MEIRGWFYFKLTESGNLIGEFSSFEVSVNSSHVADRIQTKNIKTSEFSGTYNNIWLENNKNCMLMTMKITKIKEQNNRYELLWHLKKKLIYKGLGSIVDNILIGNYESFKKQ